MKVLITGSEGFIAKNLKANLRYTDAVEILEIDKGYSEETLDEYTKSCDFVFHLAGVNRPKEVKEFDEGNCGFTEILLNSLKKHNNKAPVVVTSSIQAEFDNPYGISKRNAENLIIKYSEENNVKSYIYRLTNVFGKWCRPNYNSVVATFCHNISRDIEIRIDNRETELKLVYIDDVVSEFINVLKAFTDNSFNYAVQYDKDGFCTVPKYYKATLGEIADMLYEFRNESVTLNTPKQTEFSKALYATYLSYLPKDKFSYKLKMNCDNRGSFTELLRTESYGQVSVNISKPGIIKGEHWHNTKNEKFIVVKGTGIIRFRDINSDEIIEYKVSGDTPEVVLIPCGYTHNIENTGTEDMITVMWANECYDPQNPDTYFMKCSTLT